jgi:hypothetical protein
MLVIFLVAFVSCASHPGISIPRRVEDLPAPPGYIRTTDASGSFAAWLARLPLKSDNLIRFYNGKIFKDHHYNLLAVLHKPLLFREDLEQCVDFCLRLWSDYHFEQAGLDQLYLFNYDGKKIFYKTFVPASGTGDAFLSFLKAGLAWTNPYSITLGAQRITPADARPGDCVIQTVGRSRGQASLILDECVNREGDRLFLIGFGFSPAQEFHIEKAPLEFGPGGWFSLEGYFRYLNIHYAFYGKPALFRL